MTKPRIGVIGAGWWSTDHHMPSLKSYEKVDFCAIAELKSKKLSKAANHFEISEMEADHITPWHEGGKTLEENCQLLCKDDNRRKSGK